MLNYDQCEVCGATKTGFGTLLFCPKEEQHHQKNQQGSLYIVLKSRFFSTEQIYIAQQSTIFTSYNSAVLYADTVARIVKYPRYVHAITPDNIPVGWLEGPVNVGAPGLDIEGWTASTTLESAQVKLVAEFL